MTRLLLDEMLGAKIAEQLRNLGHDVYGIAENADLRSMTDADVLELATIESRALVTLNIADFQLLDRQWASQGRTHSGLVFISTTKYQQNRSFIGAVVAALDQTAKNKALPHPGTLIFL